MDVASHYIVGEVQTPKRCTLGSHAPKRGTDGKGSDQGAVLHLVAKEGGGEADGETQRDREGDEEMETPCQSKRCTDAEAGEETRHREEGKADHRQREHHQITLLGRQEASSVRAQDRGARHRAFRATAPGTQQ